MRLNKIVSILLLAMLVFSCNKDDDDTVEIIPPRDRGEQAIADDQALIAYLSTHFYNYEDFSSPSEDFDYIVRFDTIAGVNSDKAPIIDSDALMTKTVNYQGVDQQLYILKIREGEGPSPKYTDSVLVGYEGVTLKDVTFDSNTQTPIWFNLSGYEAYNQDGSTFIAGTVINGFAEGLEEFNAGTGFEILPDNTIKWNNDFGVGAIFMPSGLGYFSATRTNIPAYSPIIFSVNLYRINEADHDRDGIPSYLEDINGDGDVFDDDIDGDGLSNHSDNDDDGDGTLTRDEIEINEDGSINFIDSNSDGTPDYLDPDVFKG